MTMATTNFSREVPAYTVGLLGALLRMLLYTIIYFWRPEHAYLVWLSANAVLFLARERRGRTYVAA